MAILLVVGMQGYGAVEGVLPQGDNPLNKQLTGVSFTSDNPSVATIVANPNDANPLAFIVKAVNPGITVVRATDGNNVVGAELVQVGSPSGAYLPRFRFLRAESAR